MSVGTVSVSQQSRNRLSEHDNKLAGSVKVEGFLDHSVSFCMYFAPCYSLVT
jgi:hypothetical protein